MECIWVYPYIKRGAISHGKATEMLGMHKTDLIQVYGNCIFMVKPEIPEYLAENAREKIIQLLNKMSE